MKAKCFSVEKIEYKNKETGEVRIYYRVWFQLTNGVGWLYSNHLVNPGDEVLLEVVAIRSDDVKSNNRLGLKIV